MTGNRQMIVAALVAGVAILVIGGGKALLKDELSPVGIGIDAPDFSVFTLDSAATKKTLANYRGDVLLINIWATWCGPCRVEMPSIERLHEAYADKGLKVIAVSVDEPGSEEQVRSFVQQYGLTFEVLHDRGGQAGQVSRDYQTSGYPETIIVGRDGIIRKKLLGAHDWNSEENRALIERLLAEETE